MGEGDDEGLILALEFTKSNAWEGEVEVRGVSRVSKGEIASWSSGSSIDCGRLGVSSWFCCS